MIVLETAFLVDYIDGVDEAGRFLEAHGDEPFFAATLSPFEGYRGGARTGGRERIERLADGLDRLTPLPLTEEAAREAALVEAELLDGGNPHQSRRRPHRRRLSPSRRTARQAGRTLRTGRGPRNPLVLTSSGAATCRSPATSRRNS